MAKKTSQPAHKFWHSPHGYFVSAVVLLVAGYILASLAIDSGSVAQWVGAIVALAWGVMRLVQGTKQLLSKRGKNYGRK